MRQRCGSAAAAGRSLAVLALLCLLHPVPARAGDSLRCGSRIVSVGAVAAEVAALCGQPDFRDRRLVPLAYGGYDDSVVVWYYNPGPNALIRRLTFRDGELAEVATEGYGFRPPAQPGCGPGDIREGMSKYRLLAFCGEPIARKAKSVVETVPYPGSGFHRGFAYPVAVYREEWVYNFGPSYFLRRVTLDNGVVTDVQDDDDRGFNPP